MQILGFIVGVLLIVVALLLVPMATIWALNTVFALGIAYTFYTWLGILVLNLTIGGGLKDVVNKLGK